jgi:hypothetical protein
MSAKKPGRKAKAEEQRPRDIAFAMAKDLAGRAVYDFATSCGCTIDNYSENAMAVVCALQRDEDARAKDRGDLTRDDIFSAVRAAFSADVATGNNLDDGIHWLESTALDGGFLYGLAVGLALAKGGAR